MKTKKIIAAVAAFAIVCGAVPSQSFANIVKNSAVTAKAETDSFENDNDFIALDDEPIGNIVEEGQCGENVSYTLDADGVLTISGTGDMDNYDFFDTPFVFKDDERINKVIIKFGVTSIGDNVFSRCSSLESITIPDSVTSIGNSTFSGCKNLSDITIPDSVTSIGDNAFWGCNSLKSITLPDSVISIGSGAFSGTPWLETKREENPLVIVNGILIDGKNCKGDVVIPDGVTSIGDFAFSGCDSLIKITIPDSVTSIGYNVFSYCSSLESITIPDSVTSIGDCAFYYCTSLTSITIPDSVTSIGSEAFYECKNLTDITIPDSVTSIGELAFCDTPWLKARKSENPFVIVNNTIIDGENCEGDVVIPDGVTRIPTSTFSQCDYLTSVTIPDSVTSIGNFAFNLCSSLSGITIPDSVISIGIGAFCGCYQITEITIPDSVTNIGDKAFGYLSLYSEMKNKDFTIKGYKGSAAEEYANENGFEFIALDDEPITETKLGDVDGDGKITSIDASAALTYYVMNPENIEDLGFPFSKEAADWDKNGVIDSRDASAILTYYASHN